MRAMSYRAYLTSPASGARSQGLPSP